MNRLSAPRPAAPSAAGSPSGRSSVLLNATELFVSRETHDGKEQSVFRELALNMLPLTPMADRRRISCLLVRYPLAPEDVLKALGADVDPMTAYPILRHTPNLGEVILLAQIRRGPDSLRKAIAGRDDLTDPLLLALAETGSADVIEVLLAREDLTLGDDFVSRLCAREGMLKRFGAELDARKILKPDELLSHFPRLGTDLRREAIASAELSSLVQLARAGASRSARPVFKQEVLDRVEQAALCSDEPAVLAYELSYSLGLPRDSAEIAAQDETGEMLLICLKALGFSVDATARILIRTLGTRINATGIRSLLASYTSLSDGAALLLVSRWTGKDTASVAATGTTVPAAVPDASPARRQLSSQGQLQGQAAVPGPARSQTAQHRPHHQESQRARTASSSGNESVPWQEISEIEQLLKFGR